MSTRQSLIAPVPPPKAVLAPLKASPPLGRRPTALKPLGPVSPTLTPAFAPAGETDNGGLAKDVALQPLPPTSHGQGLPLTKLAPEVQPKTTTGGDAFKQAEQQLLALPPADTSGRSTLLKRLAASDQAMAWQLYQKMRALDVATFFAPAAAPEEGVVLPAALALRRCVSFVEGQAASVDLALLQQDFQPSGSPPQLLDALYFQHVAEIAQQTLSAAAERHAAASGATGSAASPSGAAETTPRVAWPELVREANAVCDAVSVLAASLAGHMGTQPSALPRLERSSVLRPCASAVAEAARAHVRRQGMTKHHVPISFSFHGQCILVNARAPPRPPPSPAAALRRAAAGECRQLLAPLALRFVNALLGAPGAIIHLYRPQAHAL